MHLAHLVLSVLVVMTLASSVAADHGRLQPVTAQAVLLVDAKGRIIFEKNPDDDRAPASLVKLMTLYLAYEILAAGTRDVDEPVTISHNAAVTPRYRMGLRAGERVPLRVLLEGVAIASANDAATAIAEHLAGSEAVFVLRMNEKAKTLGLTATRFANPHGLPDPNQRTTARDMALLTARLLADYPDAQTMLGGQTFVYRGRVYTRHIPLLDDPWGVQALKTGFTREAGYNLAVSAWKDGLQFIMVLLGARTRIQSFLDGKKLLRYGFTERGILPSVDPSPRAIPKKSVRARRSATHR